MLPSVTSKPGAFTVFCISFSWAGFRSSPSRREVRKRLRSDGVPISAPAAQAADGSCTVTSAHGSSCVILK